MSLAQRRANLGGKQQNGEQRHSGAFHSDSHSVRENRVAGVGSGPSRSLPDDPSSINNH